MLDRKLAVALLLWCLAIVAGCGETVESNEMVEPDTTAYASTASYPRTHSGQTSIEERIIDADVVARVRMVSVEAGAVDSELPPVFGDRKRAAMRFRFRVLEYLNGSGGSEIVGFVSDAMYEFITAADAMPRAQELLAARDTRWDGREAIVFLISEAGEYRLGYATLEETSGEDGYTVASRWDKRWLPEAATASPSGAVGRSGDKRFLLDDPSSGGASGAQRASVETAPTITLSALKAKVAELRSEIDAGDGSEAYRECIARRYALDRRFRWNVAQGKEPYRFETYVDSGMPTGSQADKDGPSAPVASGYWLGGRDKDLFTVVTTTPAGRPDRVLHDVVTARPLPAGEYRFNIHVIWPDILICGGWSEFVKNTGGTYVTVTAPAGVLHEAFFDPADIGNAVGADGTNGVIKPADFVLNGTNTTISSLKWESGTATMTLDPSTSLAGHAVDFIALDGSVSLTLSFDDATQGGGGALTWSVASQPWNDGDLLMLRIRSTNAIITPPTATPTPTPTAAPTATPTATPTPAATPTPTPTPMATPTPTPTPTPTSTPTPTTTEPVTVTLIPRVDGLTFFDIDIQWSHGGTCDNYYVAIITDAGYQIKSLGFHPPETSSHYVEGGWLYDSVPDFWVVVECRTSGDSQEVGRASLRAAHPDNN